MKLIKRVTALFLCFLMIGSGAVSVFAQTDMSGDSVVMESTAQTEALVSCEECGSFNIHTDICSFNTYVGRYIAFNDSELVTVYDGVDGQGFNTMSSVLADEFIALYQYTGENGAEWYELDSSDWPSSYANHKFVKADDITLGDLVLDDEDATVTGMVEDCTVTVEGNMPSDAVLELVDVDYNELDLSAFGQETPDTFVAAMDIKVTMENGEEWQPAEGETATISIDAAALGLGDGMPVNIHHEHNGEVFLLGEFTVVDGKLTFPTTGFSIFLATGLWGEAITIADGLTLEIDVGETIYLYENDTLGNRWYYYYNEPGYVAFTYYGPRPDGSSSSYSYLGVTGLRGPGTVQVRDDTGKSVTIRVKDPGSGSRGVLIDNQIAENGSLVPILLTDHTDVVYTWYRNTDINGRNNVDDYTEVTGDAISPTYAPANGINVAVDHGGQCWYYVHARDSQGRHIARSDYFWVPYSSKLENGSFEMPRVGTYVSTPAWRAETALFSQNDPRFVTTAENVKNDLALWWRTTATSADLEFIRPSRTTTPLAGYSNFDPADGYQYAELNSESVGTLYQDVLTAPGTTLYWSFDHRARGYQDSPGSIVTDTMALVLMPANRADEYAQKLAAATSTQAIRALLEEIKSIHGSAVWDNLTAQSNAWTTHSGSYRTVEGQYLTRFFFVSLASGSTSHTMGNFIDDARFTDELRYAIRYFVNDDIKEIQTGWVKPFTRVTATQTGNYTGYALEKVLRVVNGVAEDWGSTSMIVDIDDIYLDFYYVNPAISITKKVEIDNSNGSMTPDELEAAQIEIWGNFGTAIFDLKDASGITVARANVSVNPEMGEGIALFYDINDDQRIFVPNFDETYTIIETSVHKMDGYEWTSSGDLDLTISNTTTGAVSVEYTNTYNKISLVDLTITKEGSQSIDENQCFIFTVEGMGIKLDVVINGDGSVTIKDLPIGEYTVTENTDWSWRYTPDGGDKKNITLVAGDENTVTFNNTRSDIYWLSGDSYCENWWGVKNAIVVKPKEDD